ncbi:MAG: serine/threonine-protein kinase [Planctomycetota bacterium]|jgi:serine/threonine protein kinase
MNGNTDRQRELIDAARDDAERIAAQAPTSTESISLLRPPTTSFPGYEVLREIHRGGQAVVYQAIQNATKRKVAIKVMRGGPLANAQERARFEREVRILGQLQHPNIIGIHDSGTTEGWSYFVMDYLAGRPLDESMAGGERSVDDTVRLMARICRAVNAAHLHGVIHRDLKPANIWIDTGGEPHILDFGVARIATGNVTDEPEPQLMTMTGQFVGSLPWASPEQAEGNPADIDLRSDVYSLGVMLYQMLTGCFPYVVVGNMREVLQSILHSPPTRPGRLRRQVNDEVETIVLKCLSKDPERRYQSAGELARDLELYLDGEPIMAKRDSTWYVLRKSAVRHRWPIAAVLGVAAVLGSGAGAWAHNQEVLAEHERQRVATLIDHNWRAERDVDEVEDLYQAFFERLDAGRTTADERDRYLSNLLSFDLTAREIIGLDHDWKAGVNLRSRFDFEGSGYWLRVENAFLIDGHEITSFAVRLAYSSEVTSGSVRLQDRLPDLGAPALVELRTISRCTLHREEDFPGHGRPMQQPVPDPLWSREHVQTRTLLVLPSTPAGYPLAIMHRDVVEQVEAGFHAKKLWVGDHDQVGLEFAYRGPVHLASIVRFRDPETDEIAGEFDLPADSMGARGIFTVARDDGVSDDFLARVRSGEIRRARVELVPDRQSAIDRPDLDAYFGGVIERDVLVGDLADR